MIYRPSIDHLSTNYRPTIDRFCPEARKADFEALLPHASNEELTQAVQGWVSASTNNSHP